MNTKALLLSVLVFNCYLKQKATRLVGWKQLEYQLELYWFGISLPH